MQRQETCRMAIDTLQGGWASPLHTDEEPLAKKSVLQCYRVAGGAASHSDPKFVSSDKLPPIPPPPPWGYDTGGGHYRDRAAPH